MTWQKENSAKSNFAVSFVMIGCVRVCMYYIKVKILVKENLENLKIIFMFDNYILNLFKKKYPTPKILVKS